MNKATDPAALLESALIDALGAECLLGEDAKTLFSTDVYGGAIAPALVVRPHTQEQVADAGRVSQRASRSVYKPCSAKNAWVCARIARARSSGSR